MEEQVTKTLAMNKTKRKKPSGHKAPGGFELEKAWKGILGG
jgi:hypothetical protein